MISSDNFTDTGDVPGVAIPGPLGELPSCTQVYARAQALNATSVAEKPERSDIIDFYLFDFDPGQLIAEKMAATGPAVPTSRPNSSQFRPS
jgi:hypothetical protein